MQRKSPFALGARPSEDKIKGIVSAIKIICPDAKSCSSFFWMILGSKSAERRFEEIIVDFGPL